MGISPLGGDRAKRKNKLEEESKHLDLVSGFATCGMCVLKLTPVSVSLNFVQRSGGWDSVSPSLRRVWVPSLSPLAFCQSCCPKGERGGLCELVASGGHGEQGNEQ